MDKVFINISDNDTYLTKEDLKVINNKKATVIKRVSSGVYLVQLEGEKITYQSEWLTVFEGQLRVAIGYTVPIIPCVKCDGTGNEGFVSTVRCTRCGGLGEEKNAMG
jgi:hypothetical protein